MFANLVVAVVVTNLVSGGVQDKLGNNKHTHEHTHTHTHTHTHIYIPSPLSAGVGNSGAERNGPDTQLQTGTLCQDEDGRRGSGPAQDGSTPDPTPGATHQTGHSVCGELLPTAVCSGGQSGPVQETGRHTG